MATDAEIGLINAVAQIFPNSRRFLCQWHVGLGFIFQEVSTQPPTYWEDGSWLGVLPEFWRFHSEYVALWSEP